MSLPKAADMRKLTTPIKHAPAPVVPDHLSGRVRVEQVDTLARLGSAIGCIGFLSAIIIGVAFWNAGPRGYL